MKAIIKTSELKRAIEAIERANTLDSSFLLIETCANDTVQIHLCSVAGYFAVRINANVQTDMRCSYIVTFRNFKELLNCGSENCYLQFESNIICENNPQIVLKNHLYNWSEEFCEYKFLQRANTKIAQCNLQDIKAVFSNISSNQNFQNFVEFAESVESTNPNCTIYKALTFNEFVEVRTNNLSAVFYNN